MTHAAHGKADGILGFDVSFQWSLNNVPQDILVLGLAGKNGTRHNRKQTCETQ